MSVSRMVNVSTNSKRSSAMSDVYISPFHISSGYLVIGLLVICKAILARTTFACVL